MVLSSLPERSSDSTTGESHMSSTESVVTPGAWETESETSSTPTNLSHWRIVWCNERCHKTENEARRQLLSDAARAAGASLLCLKKALRFSMWVHNAQRPPFILLTDWREVKPCLQAAAAEPLSNQPTFTVVLCEEARYFERASAWVASLPPRPDPVHVCPDLGLLTAFLSDAAAKGSASFVLPQRPMELRAGRRKARVPRYFPGMHAELPEFGMPYAWQTVPSPLYWEAQTSWYYGAGHHDAPAGFDAQVLATTPMAKAASSDAAADEQKVANVLSSLPTTCGQDMGQLLQSAMPDHYDD